MVGIAHRSDAVDVVARVEPLADGLLQEVEQLVAGPRRGQVDLAVTDGEREPPDRRPGGCDHDALGQVHAVVHVAEGLVRLERRELGAVSCVDALVAEVARNLEDAFVAADHQALQEEFRGDAQAQVDVERVGMGPERPGDGTTGQALEDGRLDLDEPLLGHRRPQRGERLEPDVEDTPRVRVGQEIDLALGGTACPRR